MTDITEQKQAEGNLAAKEAQLHAALDNMPGALVYTDEHLNVVFCNDRFKDMYGAPKELLRPGAITRTFCAIWRSTATTVKAMSTP